MSDIQWIKITTNVFDDEKIRIIESLPDSDTIIVIWFKLLTLAGKCNDSGLIYLTRDIPYKPETLSAIMRRPVNTIRLALNEFQKLGMIEIVNEIIAILNWEKHQNIDKLDQLRAISRKSSEKYRQKQKQILCGDVTVTSSDYTEEEKIRREENRIDKKKKEEKKSSSSNNKKSNNSKSKGKNNISSFDNKEKALSELRVNDTNFCKIQEYRHTAIKKGIKEKIEIGLKLREKFIEEDDNIKAFVIIEDTFKEKNPDLYKTLNKLFVNYETKAKKAMEDLQYQEVDIKDYAIWLAKKFKQIKKQKRAVSFNWGLITSSRFLSEYKNTKGDDKEIEKEDLTKLSWEERMKRVRAYKDGKDD